MNLDDDLRRTLRRTPAPPDLADKVLARIAQDDVSGRLPSTPLGPGKPAPTFENEPAPTTEDAGPPARKQARRWLAAAAALTLMAAGGARYYVYQQDVAEAERVQADIRVALQITGEKLALVQRKVQDSQR